MPKPCVGRLAGETPLPISRLCRREETRLESIGRSTQCRAVLDLRASSGRVDNVCSCIRGDGDAVPHIMSDCFQPLTTGRSRLRLCKNINYLAKETHCPIVRSRANTILKSFDFFTNENARPTAASHYLNELVLLKNSSFAPT